MIEQYSGKLAALFVLKGENIMLKKTIEYTDYNGTKRVEDFYFNLSRAELAEMELGTTGGYSEMIKRIMNTQDLPTVIKVVKEFILRAYGQPSPDGRRFIKSEEMSKEFSQTEAYSNLFVELGSNAELAAAFISGIIPSPNEEEKAAIKQIADHMKQS